MNWLDRARREIREIPGRPTANTAEGVPTAALAVPDPPGCAEAQATIGSNGSASLEGDAEPVAVSDAFEERAAIMEFDGGLSREDAEQAAWALVSTRRQRH